jgi:preprotein translocase subunit YajC
MKTFTALALFIGLVHLSPALAGEGQVSAPNVVAPATTAESAATAATAGTSTTTAAPAQTLGAQQQPNLMGMAMPFLIMLGIMYFLMIRPQQKRMKEHQSLMSGLKKGDQVVTSAGIFGTISDLDEKTVMLDVSKNVSMKVLKSQVNQVVTGPVREIQ